MWGLLALVVRKGSNFESILCGLSPPVFGWQSLACIYTFWAVMRGRLHTPSAQTSLPANSVRKAVISKFLTIY